MGTWSAPPHGGRGLAETQARQPPSWLASEVQAGLRGAGWCQGSWGAAPSAGPRRPSQTPPAARATHSASSAGLPRGCLSGGWRSSSRWSLASAPRSCLWHILAALPVLPRCGGPWRVQDLLPRPGPSELAVDRTSASQGLLANGGSHGPPEASVHPGSPQGWALRRGPRGSMAMEGGQGLGHFAPRPPTPTRQHADATGASLGDFSTYGLVLFFFLFFLINQFLTDQIPLSFQTGLHSPHPTCLSSGWTRRDRCQPRPERNPSPVNCSGVPAPRPPPARAGPDD